MSRAITHETRKTSGLAAGRWGRGSPGRYLSNSLVSIQESPPLKILGNTVESSRLWQYAWPSSFRTWQVMMRHLSVAYQRSHRQKGGRRHQKGYHTL